MSTFTFTIPQQLLLESENLKIAGHGQQAAGNFNNFPLTTSSFS
jgi:hypothetical protein